MGRRPQPTTVSPCPPAYGYLDWLRGFGWAALGNLLGGLVLVTSIRILRVPHRVEESRAERT